VVRSTSNQAGREGEPLIWHGEPLEEVESFSNMGFEVDGQLRQRSGA
jgi:hypothetical protein